jgi:hypothetical protein
MPIFIRLSQECIPANARDKRKIRTRERKIKFKLIPVLLVSKFAFYENGGLLAGAKSLI